MATWEELQLLAVPRLDPHPRGRNWRFGYGSRRNCRRKTKFTSRRRARAAAISLAERNAQRAMTAYLCPICHSWHLTSEPTM